jgi:predicted nucleic acid-binding protein
MKSIYLDSNILIAYFSTDKSEDEKKKLVHSALNVFGDLKNARLCTSMWSITEMVNILVSRHKLNRGEVAEFENQLVNERRLKDLKISIFEVSPKKDYDFAEFFYHVRQGILRYHSGVGDIIHSVIMRNNGITDILTFDEKNDFKQIPGLTVVHPRDIKRKLRSRKGGGASKSS